jgi:hypothetical protein
VSGGKEYKEGRSGRRKYPGRVKRKEVGRIPPSITGAKELALLTHDDLALALGMVAGGDDSRLDHQSYPAT